jgi:hypothetical protein
MKDYAKSLINDQIVQDYHVNTEQKHFRNVVSKYYQSIPEATNIQWTDNFFDNDDDKEGIVAVFDFNYDQIFSYKTKYYLVYLLFSWSYWSFFSVS